MPRIVISIYILMLVSASSCIKEKFDPGKLDLSQRLEPGLAVPVGHSRIGMEKYLADAIATNHFKFGPDSLLILVYSDSVSSGTMGDLLSFPPISINKTILNETGFPIILPSGGPGLDFTDTILVPVSLDQTSARLDSIILRSGSLQSTVSVPGLNGSIRYEFPGLRLDDVAFSIIVDFSQGTNFIPLAGYTLITEQDISGTNIFMCVVSVHLESTSNPVPDGSEIMSILTELADLNFETIYGDLSGFEVSLPPINLNPGAFTQVVDGEFGFTDPKISLFFSNSLGVPAGIFFNPIEAIFRDNSRIPLEGAGIPGPANPRLIAYPSLEQAGISVNDTFPVDRTNSNLPDFFSSNTNFINIAADARIGPPTGSETVFINYDSRIDLKGSIEIPLWGKAEFFVMLDTISFDYLSTSLPVPEELESLTVRLNLVNSFPVSVIPQLYMLDENRQLLGSLLDEDLNVSGGEDTNGDGKVDGKLQTIDISITREKFNLLPSTYYLVMRGKISTTGFPAEEVKFYPSYYLAYNVGLIAQLKINTGK